MSDQQRRILNACEREVVRQCELGATLVDWAPIENQTGYGRRQVERVFRAAMGVSPARFLRNLRAEHAARLLAEGHDVLTASARAGYSGPGRLHDAMLAHRGVTPGEMRSGGDGVLIKLGLFTTPLGLVLMGATGRGLCCLKFCDGAGPSSLLGDIAGDFPAADLLEAPEDLEPFREALVAFLERRRVSFDPPLDLKGTAFQRRVWEELRRIPPGRTASYGGVAGSLGSPKSVRAVAAACGRNPVAIAVPCHRVIGANGALTGYRWGLDRKAALLKLEEDGLGEGEKLPSSEGGEGVAL